MEQVIVISSVAWNYSTLLKDIDQDTFCTCDHLGHLNTVNGASGAEEGPNRCVGVWADVARLRGDFRGST